VGNGKAWEREHSLRHGGMALNGYCDTDAKYAASACLSIAGSYAF
jgi:hypothetical protein